MGPRYQVIVLCVFIATTRVHCSCDPERCKISQTPTPSLNCNNAGCTEVYSMAESDAKNLQRVDLSSNLISEIPLLDFSGAVFLNMSYNNISTISDGAFGKCKNLTIFDLSHNIIGIIDSIHFEGLHKLAVLDLSFNRIKFIPRATYNFGSMGDLERLDLSHNLISEIQTYAISDLHLVSLNLAHNKLSDITDLHFVKLESLKIANFNDNEIKAVPKGILRDCTNLMELDLRNNKISTIEPNAFSNLIALEKVDLRRNQLTALGPGLFNQPQLLHLYLDGNAFAEIKPGFFEGCSAKKISLIGLDDLQIVRNGSFVNASNLETLDISHCRQLTHIEANAFGMNSSRIQTADFSVNKLRFLHPSVLNWTRVSGIDLSFNPWHCGCSLEWVKQEDVRLFHPLDMKCASPGYLQDHVVTHLHKDDFRCWKIKSDATKVKLLSNKAIMLYAAVIIVICLLAIMCIMMIWRRRKRRLANPPDVISRYTSLLNAEDGEERPPPVPRQGDIPEEKRKLTDPDPEDV